MNILEIKNLNYSYGEKEIFSNLNITLKENTLTFLTGSNLSGKTTLLKILAGMIETDNINYKENLKKDAIYISNNLVFYSKTVLDELEVLTEDSGNIKKIIKDFKMTDLLKKSPISLNYEEKQKLNIVKALLQKKKIILLDNVFTKFDKEEAINTLRILKKYITKYKLIVVVSSTDTNLLFEFDHIIIIHDNNVIFDDNYIDEEVLNKVNLNVPFICELSDKLNLYSLIEENAYTIESLVDKIC